MKKKKIPVTIPFFNGDEAEIIKQVLESGWVSQGPKVKEFEKLVAKHEGAQYGIATTSCTSALHLALIAMGIGTGDDVIVPSFTFIATANAVSYTGAVPVFADINVETFNISIDSIEGLIENNYFQDENGDYLTNRVTGNKLKAIIAVHLFGLCADIYKINDIAKKLNLKVLEDSACALGAGIDNVHQGSFGNPSCLSFHPRKSITTGEGGMILSNETDFAEVLYSLRSHGASISEIKRHNQGGFLLPDFDELGYNYRMTDIQAAIGISQMSMLDYILEKRREKAAYYHSLLSNIAWLTPPFEPEGYFHTYQSYVCTINLEALGLMSIEEAKEYRNQLMMKLEEKGISTRQGTHAVHTLGYYRQKYQLALDHCPNAYLADRLSITLPLYVQMEPEEQDVVVKSLEHYFDGYKR